MGTRVRRRSRRMTRIIEEGKDEILLPNVSNAPRPVIRGWVVREKGSRRRIPGDNFRNFKLI